MQRPGRDPGDVARCDLAIEKAVQETRVRPGEAFVFEFQPHQEALVAPEPEMPCDRRASSVGPQHIAGADAEPFGAIAIAVPRAAVEARLPMEPGSGPLGFAREPPQQVRRIGREKEIPGREEIDVRQARRIETHAVHTPRERMRDVDFLGRFLDQDARRRDPVACLALGIDHRHFEPAHGSGARRDEAGKARPHDQQIEFSRAVVHQPRPRSAVPQAPLGEVSLTRIVAISYGRFSRSPAAPRSRARPGPGSCRRPCRRSSWSPR